MSRKYLIISSIYMYGSCVVETLTVCSVREYKGKVLIQHAEMIPQTAMLMMSVTPPKHSETSWIVKDVHFAKGEMYLAGAHMAGTSSSWTTFHTAFQETLVGYLEHGLFIGEDQALLQSTCLQHPRLCAFVTPDMVTNDRWFGLLNVLHTGGNVFRRDNPLLFRLPNHMQSRPLPTASNSAVLCTLVRDEPDFIIWRWVTHHQQLGFDVVLYEHNSSHPAEWGVIHAFPADCCEGNSERCILCRECASFHPSSNKREHGFTVCQNAAYADCLHRYGERYEWIGNWDIDEYVFPFPDSGAKAKLHSDHQVLSEVPRSEQNICKTQPNETVLNHRLAPALVKILTVTNSLNLPVGLHGGTLLGYMRDCGFCPTTEDLDFMIPEASLSRDNIKVLVTALLREGFQGPTHFGSPQERNLEMKFTFNGVHVDIFVEYEHNDTHSYFPYHVYPVDGTWTKVLYTSSELEAAQFMNVTILIPSNPVQYVVDLYGHGWRTPVRWENNGLAGSYVHREMRIECIAVNCRGWSWNDESGSWPTLPPSKSERPLDVLMTYVDKLPAASYILPLLRSFRMHNQAASVIIFVPMNLPDADVRLIRSMQSPALQFSIVQRDLGPASLPSIKYGPGLYNERHVVYRNFLKEPTVMFDRVILADAGDVFFQRDPFEVCDFGTEQCAVMMAAEDSRYLYKHGKAKAERMCFGDAFVDDVLREHTLLNAGYIWGTRLGVLTLLDDWVGAIEKKKCMDQVHLIGLMRSGEFVSKHPECNVRIETDANRKCVQIMGVPYHVFNEDPKNYSHSQEPYLILGHPGNDSSVVAAVHMWDDNIQHTAHVRGVIESSRYAFWSKVEAHDSVELQCLKFGPRHTSSRQDPGDPEAHLWRAPYSHLGYTFEGTSKCTSDVCESVGSEKRLSRTKVVESIGVHSHVLKPSSKYTPWMATDGIRCHHYIARSKEHALLKSERNKNALITKQLSSGTHDNDGWFNLIPDLAFVHFVHNDAPPDICIAFLSCRRLDKLQITVAGIRQMIAMEPQLRFITVILDNGSSVETQNWIREQAFNHTILLETNIGIAAGMDQLWDACGAARFILNVEDDWVFNDAAPAGVLRESMRILGDHPDVLEVWLRNHADEFQYEPGSSTSKNGHMARQSPIPSEPLAYYIQESSKKFFPWWGAFTNGASLKHASRLRSIGKVAQGECGDEGNCESEFTAKVAFLGWKAARLCWRNDSCLATSDNEPLPRVLFTHQAGVRSPGHNGFRG